LLTVLITTAVLSIFAIIYYLSRYVSYGCFRRLRGWRRIRRRSSGSNNIVELFNDETIRNKDWMEMNGIDRGARISPHQE
jgi:hypothetical protein